MCSNNKMYTTSIATSVCPGDLGQRMSHLVEPFETNCDF